MAKKEKLKKSKYVSRYTLDPYNMDMLVAIGDPGIMKMAELYNIHFSEDWYEMAGIGGGVHRIPEYSTIAVVLHHGDAEVFAHEALHVMSQVMKHTGVKYDYDNDEPLAYFIGKIALHFEEAWQKVHK